MERKLFKISLIIFFSLVSLNICFASCKTDQECGNPDRVKCIDGKCVHALEIVYPKIGDKNELTLERISKEGIGGYLNYIFTFAIVLSGIIILGSFFFSGVSYLTSSGNPSKMAEAKEGIFSSILGALILLSATLIFNQINPEITKIELEPLSLLVPPLIPGIYVCNYKADNTLLESSLKTYIEETDEEKRLEAIKTLSNIMWDPKKKKGCYRVNYSLKNLNFEITSENTIFVIPAVYRSPTKQVEEVKWEYGIILHEDEKFGGKCKIYPQEENGKIYHQVKNFSLTDLNFTVRSITLFQKLSQEPVGDGVTIYEDLDKCQKAKQDDKKIVIKPSADKDVESLASLKTPDNKIDLNNNTRSICFSPEYSYLAIFYREANFSDKCTPLTVDNPNLLDILPLSWCIDQPEHWYSRTVNGISKFFGGCKPEVESIKVIKGRRI